ncbi:uncharacterized protein LOC111371138 [Olea europaea var. sylvestris]|uniref:uncharacterized protein LOC111371138 n=1 Tax=Olea europaea var. sylvestris TaxID=158386 RepID=UPI000C1D82FA|nr:uncharacterized protein LOC111371138 [Olea europaea var. sylvestris]
MRVDQVEIEFERDPTLEHRDLLHHAYANLNQTLAIDEGFWKQKARSHWVCEGDHNTRYFHAMPVESIRPDIIHRILTEANNMALNLLSFIDEVLEDDVYSVIIDFFEGGHLPRGFAATSIVLLPKRSGFVPGHHIGDNILLTQELLHTLNNKVRGGNSMLKLNTAKAYDCINLVSDLVFADNIIIFANGQKKSIGRVIECLEHHEGVSRQLVINEKSVLILPRRPSDIQIRRLVILTGFSHLRLSFTYLRVPMSKGAKRSILFDGLIMKIRSRISRWASRLLFPGNRMTLLRFLRDSKDHARRLHWRKWKELCYPIDEDGLGFRRLQDKWTHYP